MEVGVSRLFLSVEMFIHRRYNRRRENEHNPGMSDTQLRQLITAHIDEELFSRSIISSLKRRSARSAFG